MTAAAIATALGDACRAGHDWRCRCPLHGGRNLTLRDGTAGRILVKCWGGCDPLDVLAELRKRGLLGRPANYAPRTVSTRNHDEASRTARALNIWRNTQRGAGTIVARESACDIRVSPVVMVRGPL